MDILLIWPLAVAWFMAGDVINDKLNEIGDWVEAKWVRSSAG